MVLKDSVALVTGSAKRVGRSVAVTLASRGVKLALHYNTSSDAANSLLQEVESLGAEALLIQADLADVSAIQKMLDSCQQRFGRIDILINNAAAYFKTPLSGTTEDDWHRLIDVNLKAPFFCAKLVADYMQMQQGGKIINISDVAAANPWVDYLPYCISKAGVVTLTRGLAKELAPDIQVNAVAPGTVLMSDDASEDYTSAIQERTLLKRIGQPQDIANTIVFLLEGSDYITGAVIPVDGGSSLF